MSLLTVGMPVFNAMPYLPESLESILRQSYKDFEILVINDGSNDGSREYLQSVRDPRLRIINQKNKGVTATLNRMLAEIKTPWLARHDADDLAYPHRMARVMEYIRAYPDAGMFYSLAKFQPKSCFGRFRTTKGSPSEIRELVVSGYLPIVCHPTVVLNAARTRALGGYRFNLHVEDIDLWWRMALCYDIQMIPEVTVGFRQNIQGITSSNLRNQILNTLYIQYLLLSHLWKQDPLPYERTREPLFHLLNSRKLSFRAHMRAFNIHLGAGDPYKAFRELGRAVTASPAAFLGRVLDEFAGERVIALGEPPARFAAYADFFWPMRRMPLCRLGPAGALPQGCAPMHQF